MAGDVPTAERPFGWMDFESEPEMTGDGSGDPETHYLTIGIWDEGSFDDEVAVICHRLVGGKYPLDGPVAEHKRRWAQHIVDLLNDSGYIVPREG